jgi:hypothetical protein
MENQTENSTQESLRKEKLKTEEAQTLSKDQERSKVYLDRENKIEKGQKIKETQRTEDRVSEDIKELAKEKARKEAYLAREKIIANEQETRKLKNNKG